MIALRLGDNGLTVAAHAGGACAPSASFLAASPLLPAHSQPRGNPGLASLQGE
jgi:hypothetical protein